MKAILFSGGYDSTCLLNRLMKSEKELTIVSIKCNYLAKNKMIREEKARDRILNYLKAKYYNCKLHDRTVEINLSNAFNSGLSQPLLWLPIMQLLTYNDMELNFSYICDDQATIHMNDFTSILEISSRFQHSNYKIIPEFPLRYMYKRDIIQELVREDKFLFENATSCEGIDKDDFCGECVPCKCLRSTLIDLCYDTEVSDKDKEYYRNFLSDKFKTRVNLDFKILEDEKVKEDSDKLKLNDMGDNKNE